MKREPTASSRAQRPRDHLRQPRSRRTHQTRSADQRTRPPYLPPGHRASLAHDVRELRPRHRRGERADPEARARRLLVRVRHPHERDLAERRAEEGQAEGLVRAARARGRGGRERRVGGKEAERDGHERVARDRGGRGGDVRGEEERVERVRAQRRVDPARAAEVVVRGERGEERGRDGGVLGRDESVPVSCSTGGGRGEAETYCDWSVQNGGTSSSAAWSMLNWMRSARSFTPVGTSTSSEMYLFTST